MDYTDHECGHFSDLDRLPTELVGHLKQCDSPLSELNSKGMIAFYEDARVLAIV